MIQLDCIAGWHLVANDSFNLSELLLLILIPSAQVCKQQGSCNGWIPCQSSSSQKLPACRELLSSPGSALP